MKKQLTFLCCLSSVFLFSQNTLKYNSSQDNVIANISDVSWIKGHWKGEAFGGIAEEVWTAPLGDSMMGSFKLVIDNKVSFYELCTISEENETLFFRIKGVVEL